LSTTDLLLLSGGLDSTALAVIHRPAVCLTIDYGQRAAQGEIQASREICRELGLRHDVLVLPPHELGAGLMAGQSQSVLSEYPEFWPFRNTLLITLGAMYAVKYGLDRVLIGTSATDVRHRDGSPEFLHGMAEVVRMQEGGIELVAPALGDDALSLIRRSGAPDSVLGWTHSCHVSAIACGHCPGCHKHSNTLGELGWNR
jgi:7-cyano-7-deazaguanine synthase